MKHIATIALLFISIYTYAQNCFVFVGGYNKAGLHVFEMDTTTGQLSLVSTCTNIVNPTYFTLSANGDMLYSVLNSKMPRSGTVGSFSFDANTKTLTLVDTISSAGENPVYVAIDKTGQWLAYANYTNSKLSMYKLLPNKKPEALKQLIPFTGHSVDSVRQSQSHVHSAVFSPDNKYLFVPDLGADKIWGLAFDSHNCLPLTPIQSTATKPGSGPRHLIFSPNGSYAYCTQELSGTVGVYQYKRGKLKRIQHIVAHADTATIFSGSDLHLSPDGKFLYTSNRADENSLAIFSVAKNGKLTLVGHQSTLGNHPRVFALSANGKFVIVTNQVTGNVVVFKRDAKTGLLSYTGFEVKVENASCVQIRQY